MSITTNTGIALVELRYVIIMKDVKRIMIVGQAGSGKSTLARTLGSILNLPVVHIDLIHWKSGWVERSGSEKDILCAQVHAQDEWIFEGGRSPTWPERLDRADVLIWLDLSLALRGWRVFWRTMNHRGTNRPDLPEGCPERFTWQFTKWIWDTRHTQQDKMQQLYDEAPMGKQKYRLTSRGEVSAFIDQLRDL